MELSVSFANKEGPYNMFLNKCAPGKFCHVEMSTIIETDVFRVIVDNIKSEDAFSPSMLSTLMARTKDVDAKTLHVCFYIMWGDVVSVRFLNTLSNDPLTRPPEEPVYTSISLPLEFDVMEKIITYNLCQIGREYDMPRAILLLSPYTLRLHDVPSKFFCSQLVMHTFVQCNVFPEETENLKDINHMTPSGVYDWLKSVLEKNRKDNSVVSESKE